ncbi:MAG: SAM-dependent methyltransferase [Thiotrichales bacterium]|nr:MAG: SAM-dependent methyltransferase [Thiotrichales bacterium]
MSDVKSEATTIFSKTVKHYTKYRPSYPSEIVTELKKQCALTQNSKIADVGSGTGIFTELLLQTGATVYAVEPNNKMRKEADFLKKYKNFHSVNAAAGKTGLADKSIDIITVATAFHWFNVKVVSKEFNRILKPNGVVFLVWNLRDSTKPLMQDYDNLLMKYGVNYATSPSSKLHKQHNLSKFFEENKMTCSAVPNAQIFDFAGFSGRLMSTSYCPKEDADNFKEMMAELKKIFDKHQQDGKVTFAYQTTMYYGPIAACDNKIANLGTFSTATVLSGEVTNNNNEQEKVVADLEL